jgi:hypothetical protein
MTLLTEALAKRARDKAACMKDPAHREVLERIAEGWDKLSDAPIKVQQYEREE